MNFNLDQMVPYRDEVKAAVLRTIDSGWYLGGVELKEFEREFAEFTGQQHAVGVGNGTDAIRIALLAAGIGPGDEVLTPAFCVGFTALAIAATGATPVFVDSSSPDDPHPAWHNWIEKVTPNTRAIVPVDIFGEVYFDQHSVIKWARETGLVIVEDAAHAHGHPSVGYGDVTAYSFYPTKNLGALGEAGAITTNIPALAERARLLRDGGRTDRYVHVPPGGLNSMLDDIQAAVLRVKLRYLKERNAKRRAAATYYRAGLSPLASLGLPDSDSGDVNHLYVVRTSNRDVVVAKLRTKGIPTLIHYPLPVPLQPVFIGENLHKGPWPNAEELARTVFSLPLHADITRKEQDKVIDALCEILA